MVISIVAVGAVGAGAATSSSAVESQAVTQVAAEDTLYRANAGGGFTTGDGEEWSPLIDYMVAGGDETSSHGQPSSIDSSVPDGTPSQIWETERWDPEDGEEMQYEFSVPDGQQVEVRLYFYDGYSGTSSVGDRVFDVSVEDQTIENFDIIEEYGDDTGAMKSFTVTSDGTIDVDFAHVTENPQINAIEIVEAESKPDELGASPSSVDFGTVVTGDSQTETVTLTNLGNASNESHPDITVEDVSITGTDADQFSQDFSGSVTLAPGESTTVDVTYAPDEAQAHAATMEVTHNGTNSPVTVDLTGEGASDVPVGFSKSQLQGFSAGNPTAIDFGPDGRAYVSTQGGTVYALEVERTGEDSYQVVEETQIDAIKDIPNHDDFGNLDTGETNRQITGLTVGGTASQPVVYVSSSDPEIDVGQDDDDTDTNSGAISRLTFDWNDDGSLASLDHDVMVLGLPRSEENHATNGLDLTDDESTLYVAQGGHTNKGAPGDNFGHTPEYALSAAALEIDLAQIEANYQEKSLQNENSNYPDLDYYYSIPTVQGGTLPFGGEDGLNQAKIVEGGPVQVYSPGYRNPYDLVLSEDEQLYVIDNGPNGGWGGQPADSDGDIVESDCTNHPNEDGSYGTGDQLHLATEGSYGGHAAPIRANPDGAGLYDADGNQYFDFNASNTPVPFDMANPIECDYQDPSEDNSIGPTFGWTGGITEYTASNFDGGMQGDLLVVEAGSGTIKRVQLNAAGDGVTDVSSPLSQSGALGVTAQGDTEAFAGTVWTANHGGGDVTVFEPDDFDGSTGDECTGDYDSSLDEDGDGYDNADEIDAGSDPCSAASTPPDFDDDGTSNLNDPDDDNDGINDTEDLFAVDPNNGLDNDLPATYDFEPNSYPDTILDLGFTGVMMNGSNYQDLYDSEEVIAGGAANVLTVESVDQNDAYEDTNTQRHGYQVGVNADEPFTVETTVNGLPSDAESFQSQGVFVGTGDQDNYVKLTATGFSSDGNSGVQLAKEESGSFTDVANPPAPTAGNATTLSMTMYPSNGTVEAYYTMEGGEQQFVDETTVPTSWFDTADGNGTAVGVIATSNGADSTFDATWQNLYVEPLEEPANQPPTADAGTDQTVDEGTSVTLDATGSSDPDGDSLSYSWTQTAGTSVSLTDADTATPTFTAPEVDADETLTFQVDVSDGEDTDTDEVNVTVQDTDLAAGEALHRVNAGGAELAALDDGPDWSADTGTTPSQYLVDPSGTDTYNGGDEVTPTDDVPDSTPDAVFDTERYDEPDDGTPMEWEFPVEDGQQVEVRLYFGNQFSGTSEEGQREFNVSIEDQQVLTNYDPVADVGHANGTMKNFTVTSDGTIDVDFAHGSIENPMVNAIEIVAVDESDDTLTIEEAVASYDEDGDDTQIEFTEIQTAINWWQTDAEVPNTGGQTIDFQKMQELINLWQTDATIGDDNEAPSASFTVSPSSPTVGEDVTFDASDSTDDSSIASYEWDFDDGTTASGETATHTFDEAGDYDVTLTVTDDDGVTDNTTQTVTVSEPAETASSAELLVTPNSGTEASTYGGGSFQLTNTGEESISTFTMDLSSTSMPDMVWDPNGTAGDQAAKGLQIDSESGDGVGVVSTDDEDVFSQPHNGVNDSDGYDVLTIEFTDFEPGETVTFSADNDPTSIKGATVSSQEAGPVSGLELARANVNVEYADGSVQETQLFGDGSEGGAQATLNESVASAPSIGVQGVTLDEGVLRDHHSAATVSEADQTVTVTGQPGETVTLLHVEAELELENVPDTDGSGEPGYDIEDYEANKIEQVNYETVTLDSNGEATVPVTLLNTTDVGGYNYFVATHGEPGADTGLDSNVVVLKLEEGDTGDTGDTSFATNAGGDAYTASDGTEFQADTAFTGGTTYSVSQDINNTEDDPLYQTERYGDFSYDVPLQDGEYEVTLHFAEIYQGVSESDTVDSDGPDDGTQENDRVFNVSIEDQQVLAEYDIYAEVGPLNATQETFTVEVTDGELNVEFTTIYDNAKVSAIEVEPVEDDENTAPTVDAIDDQTVTEGNTTQVAVNASDADGDSLTLSADGPDFVSLTDDGDGNGTLDIVPQDGDSVDSPYTINVTVDDGTDTATESFQLTVEEANELPTASFTFSP
ncbi:malectin domain-containing carbohydrate-binding protein, partial [Natronomonas sp.]|uniref:malectin domain-containing carbohydrate-binding protein n=1 Tax=Natronomonas sp. TaxID=2184060 RepID=UPI002FC33C77